MNNVLLIFSGFCIGAINSMLIQWTVKNILITKKTEIAIISFFTRFLTILIIFYFLINNSWKNGVFLLIGLTVSKIIFILKNKQRYKKNGNHS